MTTENTPVLKTAVPIFSVENLEASLLHYEKVLGFTVGWKWGDPPYIASVCRDNVELNLTKRGQLGPAGSSNAYFYVSAIDAFYDSVKKAGAQIKIPLEDRNYGMRDFGVLDLDGNELHFGEAKSG